jgi:hypothetical protein
MVSGKNLVFQVTENHAAEGVLPSYHDISSKERITMVKNDFRFFMYHVGHMYLLMHKNPLEDEMRYWQGIRLHDFLQTSD